MASSKVRLRIPKDVELELDAGPDANGDDQVVSKPFRFVKDFVFRHILNDKRWIQDSDWTFAGMEIRGLYKDALTSGAEFVELTNDQAKKVKECAEKPSGGWTIVPQVMFQITHYIEALITPVKEEELKKVAKPAVETVDEPAPKDVAAA
jgi:hypothetical protein